MTEFEQRAVRALDGVKPGCFNRAGRFIDWLVWLGKTEPARTLKPHQVEGLWRLVYRFRRQIDDREIVRVAGLGGEEAARNVPVGYQRDLFF